LGKCKTSDVTAQKAAHFPTDLQRVIDAWPDLPEDLRAAIVAILNPSPKSNP